MKFNIFYRGPHKFNLPVFLITIGIAIFGIIMVHSASCYNAERLYDDAMFFTTKQIIGVILGIVVMVLCYFIDYQILKKFWLVALGLGIVVLLIVFIPGIGIESYGAKRWIGFGAFSFQASEIAKFCFTCSSIISTSATSSAIFNPFGSPRIAFDNSFVNSAHSSIVTTH